MDVKNCGDNPTKDRTLDSLTEEAEQNQKSHPSRKHSHKTLRATQN